MSALLNSTVNTQPTPVHSSWTTFATLWIKFVHCPTCACLIVIFALNETALANISFPLIFLTASSAILRVSPFGSTLTLHSLRQLAMRSDGWGNFVFGST